ncbi:MAG: hypothetical protein AAFQ64_01695 [Pseudomonadota bacterium]
MKLTLFPSLIAIAALAACGGSTGDDGDGSEMGIISTGILTDVEVPSNEDLEGLPADVQALVNDFVTTNESITQTETRPSGTATYTGDYGFGFDTADNDTVVVGDMTMSANFDLGTINGTVTNLSGQSEGMALTISNDLTVLAAIDNVSDIAGTVAGDVELEGETYSLSASIDGAFGGTNAETALGTTMGEVTNPDNTVDGFSGYFLLDRD